MNDEQDCIMFMIYNGRDHPRTSSIQYIIDKYGVNYRDRVGDALIDFLPKMSEKQMDLVFKHKPDLFDGKSYPYCRCYIPVVRKCCEHHEMNRFIMLIQKMMDYDTENRYFHEFKGRILYSLQLDIANRRDNPDMLDAIRQVVDIILNKEKRVLSMFELMYRNLNIRKHINFNKK